MAIISVPNRWLIKQSMERSNFALDKGTDTIIFGDSHTEAALDPTIIRHSVNVSCSSENYFFTYYKVKLLLDTNPEIKQILVACAPHNLARSAEKALYDEDKTAVTFPRYFMLIDNEGITELPKMNQPFIVNYLRYRMGIPVKLHLDLEFKLDTIRHQTNKENYPFWGGFYRSKKSNLDKQITDEAVRSHYFDSKGQFCGTSPLMLKYLKKIIILCESRNVKVYLFNSPLHPDYSRQIPEIMRKAFDHEIKYLLLRHRNISYLDYTESNLPHDQYGDCNHLNLLGASTISKEVDKIIAHNWQ